MTGISTNLLVSISSAFSSSFFTSSSLIFGGSPSSSPSSMNSLSLCCHSTFFFSSHFWFFFLLKPLSSIFFVLISMHFNRPDLLQCLDSSTFGARGSFWFLISLSCGPWQCRHTGTTCSSFNLHTYHPGFFWASLLGLNFYLNWSLQLLLFFQIFLPPHFLVLLRPPEAFSLLESSNLSLELGS